MIERLGLVNSVVLNHYLAMNKIPGNSTAFNDAPQDPIEEKNAFDALVCTNTALRLAARRLGNLYDEALAPVGLKATQVSLLTETTRMAAANEGKAPTLQDLAAKLAIQISALTHALKPLIRDGLVELQADEQDRRTKRAVLTSAGTALLQEAIVHWSTANRRVEEVLGAEAAASLRTVADYVASEEFLAAYMGG